MLNKRQRCFMWLASSDPCFPRWPQLPPQPPDCDAPWPRCAVTSCTFAVLCICLAPTLVLSPPPTKLVPLAFSVSAQASCLLGVVPCVSPRQVRHPSLGSCSVLLTAHVDGALCVLHPQVLVFHLHVPSSCGGLGSLWCTENIRWRPGPQFPGSCYVWGGH